VVKTPPDVTIVSPPGGGDFEEGVVIDFEARVNDDVDALESLVLIWSSDIDGELLSGGQASADGTVVFATANLSGGYTHTVRLDAIDSDALAGNATVAVNIVSLPDLPDISVVQPGSGQSGQEGQAFEFVAQVSDAHDLPEALLVEFETDQVEGVFCDPTPDETGKASCEATLSPGVHALTYTVEDSEGFTGAGTTYFTVVAATEIDDDGDGWTETQGDCDDTNPNINPGVPEFENGLDDNCDGEVDESTDSYDDDGDGYSENEGDCDDTDVEINPGQDEICDNDVDENCDDSLEAVDAIGCQTYYLDYDGDGFGSSESECLCGPDGYYTVVNSNDCYDENADASPTQGGYFTVSRGDGSYDYDCDGSETKYDTSSGDCSWFAWSCTATTGWSSGVPSCGDSSNYVTDCSVCGVIGTSCCAQTSASTQACK